MLIVSVLVFIVTTAILVSGYFVVTMLPGVFQRRQVDRRLNELSAPMVPPSDEESVVVRNERRSLVEKLAGRTSAGQSLERLIEQSGVRITIGAVVALSVASGLLCGVAALLCAKLPWAGIAAGCAGCLLPTAWLMRKRSVRRRRFEEMFPEALDLLSRAIRAGHAFQTAMGMVADELGDPVGPEFRKTFDQQNFGLPLRDAMNAMAERVGTMDVKFFVTAVLIQRETGGNLSEILDNLAHVVRERFKVLRQVRVHTAHGRFTGWVLLALPAALAVALSFISPDQMKLLTQESMGQTMLIVAVVLQTIGFLWIKRVVKIEV
jgi:tight adherence protein B